MQSSDIEVLIMRLLQREGGYVYHTDDRGGPTNMGITQATLSEYRGYAVTSYDVRELDVTEARAIYRKKFWDAPGFGSLELHPVVTEMIFDTAAHSGPGRAVKILQQVVKTEQDGVLGPITRAAARGFKQDMLAAGFMGARVAFLGRVVTQNPSQVVFAAGWFKRMQELIKEIPNVQEHL